GEWNSDRILGGLGTIALKDADDRWTRAAIATAVPERAGELVDTLVRFGMTTEIRAGQLALLQELGAVIGGRRNPEEVVGFLDTLAGIQRDADRWQRAGLHGLTEGMGRRGTRLGDFLKKLPEGQRKAGKVAESLLARAAEVGADDKREPVERAEAIQLLAH